MYLLNPGIRTTTTSCIWAGKCSARSRCRSGTSPSGSGSTESSSSPTTRSLTRTFLFSKYYRPRKGLFWLKPLLFYGRKLDVTLIFLQIANYLHGTENLWNYVTCVKLDKIFWRKTEYFNLILINIYLTNLFIQFNINFEQYIQMHLKRTQFRDETYENINILP
jgi:hypothetical protein